MKAFMYHSPWCCTYFKSILKWRVLEHSKECLIFIEFVVLLLCFRSVAWWLQVFMLNSQQILDEQTMLKILESGHSRIPIHKPDRRYTYFPCLKVLRHVFIITAEEGIHCSWKQCVINIYRMYLDVAAQLLLFLQGGDHRSPFSEGAYHSR